MHNREIKSSWGNWQCTHTATVPVFVDRKRNIKVYGATGRNFSHSYFDLILDVGRIFIYRGSERVKGPEPYQTELNKLIPTLPPLIELDWPDMDHPNVSLNFWKKLWELIPDGTKLCICCIGGHGRTGTAIASLMIINGKSPLEAVGHIRRVYCEHAIESIAQEQYLCHLWKMYLVSIGHDVQFAEKSRMRQSKAIDALYVPEAPRQSSIEEKILAAGNEATIEDIETYLCDNCGDPVDEGVIFSATLLPSGMEASNGDDAVLCGDCFGMINEALNGLIAPSDIKVKIIPTQDEPI